MTRIFIDHDPTDSAHALHLLSLLPSVEQVPWTDDLPRGDLYVMILTTAFLRNEGCRLRMRMAKQTMKCVAVVVTPSMWKMDGGWEGVKILPSDEPLSCKREAARAEEWARIAGLLLGMGTS